MTITDAKNQFESTPACTEAFKKLSVEMRHLIEHDIVNAASYLIIYEISWHYFISFEDQGLEPKVAEKAKRQMLGYLNSFEPHIVAGEWVEVYKALGNVSNDYLLGKHTL